MPFKSEKQRRYLYANEPKLAKKWSNMYGDKIVGLGNVKSLKGKSLDKEIKNTKKVMNSLQKLVIDEGNMNYYKDLMGIQTYYLKLNSLKSDKDFKKFLNKKNIPFTIQTIKNGKKIPVHLQEISVVHNPVFKQGYKDREDESLGMRRGAERGKKQSYKDRRNESYGKFGKRDKEKKGKNKINKKISGLGGLSTDEYLMRIASTLLSKGLNPSKYTKSKAKALLKNVKARKKVYELIDKKSADIVIYMKRIKNL